MKKMFFIAVSCLAITLWAQDLTFGVVPQQSPLVLSKKWIPITKELSRLTGHDINFRTESSITLFEKALYSGKYDIAYMNPYHYVVAHKKNNYKALVRAKKNIQGIVVSTKEKSFEDISNKKKERFLFPAPNAFAATLLIKYEFKKNFNINIDKQFTVHYVNSHDSVYKGVARKIGSYGGGIIRTFKNLSDAESKNKLHIIHRSNMYPSHPIAFHQNISLNTQEKITKAILNLPVSLLQKLNIKQFIPTDNQEYDIVKNLAVELDMYE